ncbi:type IV toxin-antitoxin system AbiEi family antitoxin domain-containing protein [Propionispira raffinosivorans]|uniref:type IV toxin-antitoxin system AbiEi family antitoxin domain-containing protein n=1 Tax=Propionispira raffinosivorans TaxID=86959 RepID=UPI000378AFFC|nr:type IV toxin-antitoxin system AbiEi family antitoxin domain-containing protein [Propionispira raffinosivorans]
MTILQKLEELGSHQGGIITTKDAARLGISRAMLSNLYLHGQLERIARGQYILPNGMEDELLSIALRSSKIIFSHETALYLHGLSDRTPFVHSVTAPSNCVPNNNIQDICKVYYIKPDLFEMGRVVEKSPAGNLIPVYDIDRTICDVVRSRNKLGTETFLFAVKAYAKSKNKNLNTLGNYAKQLRITNVIHRYLEVLL